MRYTKEEHARLGDAIYEQKVRSLVENTHHGKIVAIDVDSGSYEVGDDSLSAARSLLARIPEAQVWCVRIGYPFVHRFGSYCKPRTI